ncbi:MAG: prepilin peptidase [Candidatus Omnitrophica bacterium]|nr:prepilin peptidase [Candidatus Omnitrophota bacterium]
MSISFGGVLSSPVMEAGICLLVFLLGLLTSYTDITRKKIRNEHLLLFFLLVIAVRALQPEQFRLFAAGALLNASVAAVIASLLYMSRMWCGGDAKLFILYSLLMKPTGQEGSLLASPVVLFITTFFAAFIVFIPFEICQACRQDRFRQASGEGRYWDNLKLAFLGFSSFNWMIFPILYKMALFRYPVVVYVFTSLVFPAFNTWVLRGLKRRFVDWKLLMLLLILGGFVLHIMFIPREQLLAVLGRSLRSIVILSTLFYFFKSAMDQANASRERVPFAPILMAGYFLSYTDMLKTASSWMLLISR